MAWIACSLNKLKSATLRAALIDVAPSMAVVGIDRSKPASPAPGVTGVPPGAAPIGERMGQLVPVACPMDWEIGSVGVGGVTPGMKAGSGVFTREASCNDIFKYRTECLK